MLFYYNHYKQDTFEINFYWHIAILLQLFYYSSQFLLYCKMNQPHVNMYPLAFGLPSHPGHHRALHGVSCAIHHILISYLFYPQYPQCIYVHPNPLIHSFPPPLRPTMMLCLLTPLDLFSFVDIVLYSYPSCLVQQVVKVQVQKFTFIFVKMASCKIQFITLAY